VPLVSAVIQNTRRPGKLPTPTVTVSLAAYEPGPQGAMPAPLALK
jgi:hypothetical protein